MSASRETTGACKWRAQWFTSRSGPRTRTFPDGGLPGYTYVDTGVDGAVPGGISPLQGGAPLVTFFVGVQDVAATLKAAEAQGGRVIQPATSVPGVTFGLLADPQGQVVGLAQADT